LPNSRGVSALLTLPMDSQSGSGPCRFTVGCSGNGRNRRDRCGGRGGSCWGRRHVHRAVAWLHEKEAEHFPYREHKQVKLVGPVDLADEAAVSRLFAAVPALWASVHIAGGFAMGPVAKTSKAELMQQIDINLASCFLCCAA